MVVCRKITGSADIIDPKIEEADCWVELHGIPSDTLQKEALQLVMEKIGRPLTELVSVFRGNRHVFRQKLKVNITEALKPKVAVRHPSLGICWAFVVYENVSNICMFCAKIGHEHTVCPARFRLKQLQQMEEYKERLGNQPIPERKVRLWINDRTLVPRDSPPGGKFKGQQNDKPKAGSSQGPMEGGKSRKTKKNMEGQSSNGEAENRSEEGHGDVVQDERQCMYLNFKRVREAIPNSPPSAQ